MKMQTKRIQSLALAVLMVAALLAGCGGKSGNAGTSSVTEKLQNVNSYELTLFNSSEGAEMSCTVQVDVENQTFYVVDESMPFTEGENTTIYGQGNTVYRRDANRSPLRTDKLFFSEKDFNGIIGMQIDGVAGLPGLIELSDAFLEYEPKKDGNTYRVDKLTAQQYCDFLSLMSGGSAETPVEEVEQAMAQGITVSAYMKLDDSGVLQEIALEQMGTTVGYRIGKLNQVDNIPAPEYASNFVWESGAYCVYEENGQKIVYEYADNGFVFTGFGEYFADEYDIQCYTVKTTVEDMPVLEVRGTNNNGFNETRVHNLVIPSGIGLNTSAGWENWAAQTTFFFEDSLESASITAYENDASQLQMYFAGEWSYVDGLPTPNN